MKTAKTDATPVRPTDARAAATAAKTVKSDATRMRRLIVGNILATLLAIAALTLALISISDIETTRVAGRRQSCELIDAGLRQAADPGRLSRVNHFIAHHALSNCPRYAQGPK